MSDQTIFKVNIFAPRLGKKSIYKFTFTRDKIKISSTQEVKCDWLGENINPMWSGVIGGNPLVKMLEYDEVYPPSIYPLAIEMAWIDWRNGVINNIQLEDEINVLCDWLNIITKTKPGNEYWNNKF